MRILGIDPGTNIMGYAVLQTDARTASVVVIGTVKMDRVADHYARLKRIFDRINTIINEFQPDELAIEAPFFGKNVQSMLKLGRAQGVCMAAALSHNMPVTEYAPLKIKQTITGNGQATKQQVATFLHHLLQFDTTTKYLDATDALAIAYTHHINLLNQALLSSPSIASSSTTTSPNTTPPTNKIPKPTKKSSWADFIKNNPDRVKK